MKKLLIPIFIALSTVILAIKMLEWATAWRLESGYFVLLLAPLAVIGISMFNCYGDQFMATRLKEDPAKRLALCGVVILGFAMALNQFLPPPAPPSFSSKFSTMEKNALAAPDQDYRNVDLEELHRDYVAWLIHNYEAFSKTDRKMFFNLMISGNGDYVPLLLDLIRKAEPQSRLAADSLLALERITGQDLTERFTSPLSEQEMLELEALMLTWMEEKHAITQQ